MVIRGGHPEGQCPAVLVTSPPSLGSCRALRSWSGTWRGCRGRSRSMRVSKSNWLRKPRYTFGCRGHTEGRSYHPRGVGRGPESLGAQAGWAGHPAVLSSTMEPGGKRKIDGRVPCGVLGGKVKDGHNPRDETQTKSDVKGHCCNSTPCSRIALCLLVFQRHIWTCLMGTVAETPMAWFWMSL